MLPVPACRQKNLFHTRESFAGTYLSAIDRMAEGIKQRLNKMVGKAMSRETKAMTTAIRNHVATRMTVQKKSFVQNFRVRVLDDEQRLPAMWVYSRSKWAGVHEFGVTIGGKMLIPINGRVGRKQFKAYVEELMRSGNAYFIKKGGKTILMAENIKESDRPLAGFKRRHRKAEGIKRLKRGASIPIAILVNRVTVPKRLGVAGVVRGRVPILLGAIQTEVSKLRQ